ncbi:MAG TPA: 3-hydroxyacyl-CoA dehydrogenase NAD-binding domain-containing protein, partial [Actinomycetes bacterium]|nr:3-hydroxyacyl-CoA dehydrogenase NAD-binding domain-containing protein [Actinomycetes bacterium]
MSESTIRWEQDADGIVVLTLDDPSSSANTMNDAYVRSMGETVDRLEREKESIRGVVLTSAKKTFFAGGDLGALIRATPETRAEVLATVTRVKSQLRRLETLGLPVAAAVNGAALGGGLEIALAAHHRVVLDDPTVKLGFPEVTLGLLPGGGGVVRSVRLLGLTTALLELLLQGQQIRPGKALKLGLVHELAADRDELLVKAKQWVLATETAQQPYDAKGYKVPGGTPSSPSLASSLPAFPANLTKQLKGAPYPAPHAILAAAVESLQVDVDTAFIVEGRYFVDLVGGQISTNMIQAFWFDLNRVNGGASRPDGPERFAATKVGVLGAGMMGAGIAHAFAKVGVGVVLKDVSVEAAEKGKAHVAALVGKQVERGRMTQDDANAFLARITPTAEAADLAGCDAIVEAMFEDQALKHRVLREAEQHARPDAFLASNTSTLPITGLAEGVQRQDDVVGMHFFSPVDKMPLVELIVGERTSDEALARAYDVVR